jgi:hypothetical protein
MPLFFLIVFFSLYLTGAGNYSMDAIIWQKSFVKSEFEASLKKKVVLPTETGFNGPTPW